MCGIKVVSYVILCYGQKILAPRRYDFAVEHTEFIVNLLLIRLSLVLRYRKTLPIFLENFFSLHFGCCVPASGNKMGSVRKYSDI